MKDKKKSKLAPWDDGRTVAPMNGDELPYYRRVFAGGRKRSDAAGEQPQLTKAERRAMTRALFLMMLPRLLVVLLGFGVVAALLALWLL